MEKKVLIADDHAIIRTGIKFVIKDVFPFAVVHEARNGNEVIASVRENDYDLIILDLVMPETDPIALVNHLLACMKETRVLIFSMHADKLCANKISNIGALGYLNKQSGPKEVKKAISDVLLGTVYTSLNIEERLPELKSSKPANPFERLSEKERLLANYYLKGHSNTEIKNMLKLHASTIGTLKSRLFGKLKIKTLVELVELAMLYQPGTLYFQPCPGR